MKPPAKHSRPRSLSAALLTAILSALPIAVAVPARAEVRIFLPLSLAYTTERTIPVMGMVKDKAWSGQRQEVRVQVNNRKAYDFPLKEGYYFAGEVYLDDGSNLITVEGQQVTIFAGDDKKPPSGFTLQYGHASLDDSCDECHKAAPDEKDKIVLELIEPPEVLCRWCHFQAAYLKKLGAGSTAHDPVKQGRCLECHLPHASGRPRLLKTDPKLICAPCHQKLYEDLKTKPYIHGPLNVGGCDLCHLTHFSPEPFLLNRPEKDLCLTCHTSGEIFSTADATITPHPGIADGKCHTCHTGHASSSPKLMKKIVNNLCIECHPEKSHNFHEEKGFSIYICGRCHDIHRPDAAHLVINKSRELCEQCHKEDLGRGDFTHQPLAEKNCFECHGFHGDSMERNQSAVCHRCHPADAAFIAKHPVAMSPDVRCTQCHAPHRSTTANLTYPVRHKPFADNNCAACHQKLTAERITNKDLKAQTALCFDCHPDKKIPDPLPAGVIIHKPFVQECGSCHLTHNSAYPSLLTMSPLEMCGQCHSFVKKLSNLIPTSIHQSIKEGRCGDCHDTHLGTRAQLLKKEVSELCLGCHPAIARTPSGDPWPVSHKPLQENDCRTCHTGHYSKFPALLKEKESTLCSRCHQTFMKTLSRVESSQQHDPVRKGMCEKCHDVHGSLNRKLLKKNGNALCRPCHAKLQVGLHHHYEEDFETLRSGGDFKERKVACTECHRSHYSANNSLLIGKEAPICKECHTF